MSDDLSLTPTDAFRLDPPAGVPEPAPLDMPRRRIRRLPIDLDRLLPWPAAPARSPLDSRAG